LTTKYESPERKTPTKSPKRKTPTKSTKRKTSTKSPKRKTSTKSPKRKTSTKRKTPKSLETSTEHPEKIIESPEIIIKSLETITENLEIETTALINPSTMIGTPGSTHKMIVRGDQQGTTIETLHAGMIVAKDANKKETCVVEMIGRITEKREREKRDHLTTNRGQWTISRSRNLPAKRRSVLKPSPNLALQTQKRRRRRSRNQLKT